MRVSWLVPVLLMAISIPATAQVCPPAPGVEIPAGVLQNLQGRGGHDFQFKHAWIGKTRTIREARAQFVAERGFYQHDLIAAPDRPRLAVTGTFSIPVFCVKYSNTGADPFPTASLQTKLFDGPFAPQTLTEFYSEISYGDLDVTGHVYGWTSLPNTDAYYAGSDSCNGLCGSSRVSTLITQTLTANDGAVDFGQYDNDGPDGVPNSGDDDGYVDFVAFVQPEQGAECGVDGNIWSHRYALSGWTGSAYTTNDARSGGGSIKVDDYVIQPIYNCGGTTLIDIGVFCHEFGHAFGLPDLYDTDGGSQGVGHWCLMGSGNWHTPTQPAHMSAWSKDQLGWSDEIVVPAVPTPFDIGNVETGRTIYRLDTTQERWRRSTQCPLGGAYSMYCGLTAAEATNRNWANAGGYGNDWNTSVSRTFFYDGAGSVSLSYAYACQLESGYDFVRGEIAVGGTTVTFASYTGVGSGTANIDLTPYLSGPGAYTVRFRLTSDYAYSDEDGFYDTTCAPFVLDNISVTGGGENALATFEDREDGWAPDMSPPAEYYLVENRQPLGSDVNVWGGGGLAIWHVDSGDQTGGPDNDRPRGLALVQADGLDNLEDNDNRGDAGDPYPGSTDNQLFDAGSTPSSAGYDGPNQVSVELLAGNGDPIPAILQGGWPAPTVTTSTPGAANSGDVVQLQIDGSGFARVGSAQLVHDATTISSSAVQWLGKDRILATFDLTGAPGGAYDLVVYNPGDASTVRPAALDVTGPVTGVADGSVNRFALLPAFPNPFSRATALRFELPRASHVALEVFDVNGTRVRTLANGAMPAGAHRVDWDGRDERGSRVAPGAYFYRFTTPGFSDVRRVMLVR